jgi:rSAM/selenodomain-associated transferase 1
MKPLVFIFAKAPHMGQAKTRLAADIGRVHALRVYRAMCAKVFRECTDPRWDAILYLTPDRCADDQFGGLWPTHFPRVLQKNGDLTDRLARAFSVKRTTIAIGTDAPQIKRRDIANAVKALKTNASVFGPADDGGFWLIGLNGPAKPGVFENVRWSHPDTLSDMKSKIEGSMHCLRTLKDIDNGAALTHYKNEAKRS